MKKDILIIYPNGARGDFLNSILVGDKLAKSYRSLQILNGAKDNVPMIKMHSFGDLYNCSVQTLDDLKNYCTIRITIDNPTDAFLISCMAFYKHAVIEKQPISTKVFASNIKFQLAHLQTKKDLVWKIEQQHQTTLDEYVDYFVPFWDLFDMNKIEDLHYQVNAEKLTAEEKDRIQHNIDINLVLIEQLRTIYMVDTQS